MRVGQLRLQVHFEGRLVVHLLVAELDERGAPTTHHLPTDDRREHCIIREAEVLDDEGLAARERRLELRHERLLAKARDLDAVGLLLLLDPGDALQLRVDHERPARAARHDRAILDRDAVRRQVLARPARPLRLGREHVERVEARLGHGHAALGRGDRARQVGHVRARLQQAAELFREAARVRDEGGGEQHVAGQDLELTIEVHDRSLPARAFGAEGGHEAQREPELLLVLLSGCDRVLLLLDCRVVLGRQLGDRRLGGRLLREGSLLGGNGLVERPGRLLSGEAFRLHILVDVPVHGNVEYKVGQAGRGRRLLGHRGHVEVLEREQRPDVLEVLLGHLAGVDAILVLEKRVEEAVDVLHHALRRLPRNVNLALGAIVQQVDACASHIVDASGRRLEILELAQVLLVDRVERRRRRDEGWLGRLEVLLDRGLHGQDLGLLLGGGVGDDVGARRLGASLLLLRL